MARTDQTVEPEGNNPVTPTKAGVKLTYVEMVEKAIEALKDRRGCTRQAIIKCVLATFTDITADEHHVSLYVAAALRKGMDKGTFKNVTGTGLAGRFAFTDEAKKEKHDKEREAAKLMRQKQKEKRDKEKQKEKAKRDKQKEANVKQKKTAQKHASSSADEDSANEFVAPAKKAVKTESAGASSKTTASKPGTKKAAAIADKPGSKSKKAADTPAPAKKTTAVMRKSVSLEVPSKKITSKSKVKSSAELAPVEKTVSMKRGKAGDVVPVADKPAVPTKVKGRQRTQNAEKSPTPAKAAKTSRTVKKGAIREPQAKVAKPSINGAADDKPKGKTASRAKGIA